MALAWNKIPWTPLLIGGVVLYGLSKLKSTVTDLANVFSPDDPLVKDAQLASWWTANYVPAGKHYHGMTEESANTMAADIYDADGYTWNDFNKIIATFKKLQYKSQLSKLVATFQRNYGKDLLNFITSFIGGGSEMVRTVLTYTNSLPSGIV